MSGDHQGTTKVSDRQTGSATAAESPQPVSFEEGLSRLADLVGGLEGGRMGLSDSIAAYEQGVALVRRLHAELADVEQRVKTLTAAVEKAPEEENAEDGPSEPSLNGATSQSPTAGSRKGLAKRSADRPARGAGGRPRRLPGMDDPSAEV